jgi:hypothetical protein
VTCLRVNVLEGLSQLGASGTPADGVVLANIALGCDRDTLSSQPAIRDENENMQEKRW